MMLLPPFLRVLTPAFLLLGFWLLTASVAAAQQPPVTPPPPAYALLAGLVIDHPVIVRAEIRRQSVVKPVAGVAPVPPGQVRLILQARVSGVLTAPAAVPEQITIFWQGPLDARGKPPRFAKRQGLVFLKPAGQRDDQFRLGDARAILAADPATEARLRALALEARAPAFRGLQLTGVSEAFSQPDEPPFARRTVFFLSTASGRPVSLYLRAHGDDPLEDQLLFTTSDFLADGAPVSEQSLAWYHLACRLERSLPPAVLAAQPSEADAVFLEADFARVFAKLGPCA